MLSNTWHHTGYSLYDAIGLGQATLINKDLAQTSVCTVYHGNILLVLVTMVMMIGTRV